MYIFCSKALADALNIKKNELHKQEMKVISTSLVEGLMIRNELDLAESYRVEGVYSNTFCIALSVKISPLAPVVFN